MQITGTVKKIGGTIVVSEKFQKRQLIVETQDKYPQTLEVQYSQDKCQLLDLVKEGDIVVCETNLRGREWSSPQGEVKYFLSLEGWAISINGSGAGSGAGSFTHHDFQSQSGSNKLGNIERNFEEARLQAEHNDLEEDDDTPF